MQGLEKIWKDKRVSVQTKTRNVNAVIFPRDTVWLRDMDKDRRNVEEN